MKRKLYHLITIIILELFFSNGLIFGQDAYEGDGSAQARKKFVWPLEILEDGKTKLMMRPKNFEVDDELDEFEKQGYTEIWITPKIPFMIPLLLGFICTFVFGDILFSIMQILI